MEADLVESAGACEGSAPLLQRQLSVTTSKGRLSMSERSAAAPGKELPMPIQ